MEFHSDAIEAAELQDAGLESRSNGSKYTAANSSDDSRNTEQAVVAKTSAEAVSDADELQREVYHTRPFVQKELDADIDDLREMLDRKRQRCLRTKEKADIDMSEYRAKHTGLSATCETLLDKCQENKRKSQAIEALIRQKQTELLTCVSELREYEADVEMKQGQVQKVRLHLASFEMEQAKLDKKLRRFESLIQSLQH